MVLITGLVMLLGIGWQLGIALGGVFAMSSTAVLTKLLAERMQLDSAHGREVMGVLLFHCLLYTSILITGRSIRSSPMKAQSAHCRSSFCSKSLTAVRLLATP